MPDTPSIFISHAHEDKKLARALTSALGDRGYHVWLDEVELRIGDSLVDRIADAIAEGDFVLAIVSPDSLESKWCQQELAWAASKGIAHKHVVVLPIRHRGAEMPAILADKLWADADAADVNDLAERIARDIERHRGNGADGSAAARSTDAEAGQSAAAIDPAAGLRALGDVAERSLDLLAQWDRCRNGDSLDALTDKQRRLRLSLVSLPGGVAAVPVATHLATAAWGDYFRVSTATEVEPDLTAELDAARNALAHGRAPDPRWRVIQTFGIVSSGGRDADVFLWEIARADESRRIEVVISRTAMASTAGLPSEVMDAKATEGRSAVLRYLGEDDPPRMVSVSTAGITP